MLSQQIKIVNTLELQNQRNKLLRDAEAILRNNPNAEERSRVNKILDEADVIEVQLKGTNGRPYSPIAEPYKPAQLFRSVNKSTPDHPMFGSYMKAIVTGDWSGMESEKRDAMSSVNAAGGYTLPMNVSSEVIDFARAKSVCMDAGARTMMMGEGFVRIPRLASDPVGTWHVENDLVTPTAITFEAVDLKARTLVALVQCSIELFEDSAVINEVMRNSLSKALGQQLDAAILRGTGTAVPLGIRNTTNVTVTPAAAGAGAVISRELISNACQTIWSANGTPNAVIMSPREYGILDRSVDSLTQPLKPFPSYDSLTKLFTSAIPVNLDSLATPATQTTSECYVGDFSEVIVGMRTNFTVEATRGFAGAFDHLQVAVRLYGRFDVAVSHPQHFVVISNLKAS